MVPAYHTNVNKKIHGTIREEWSGVCNVVCKGVHRRRSENPSLIKNPTEDLFIEVERESIGDSEYTAMDIFEVFFEDFVALG